MDRHRGEQKKWGTSHTNPSLTWPDYTNPANEPAPPIRQVHVHVQRLRLPTYRRYRTFEPFLDMAQRLGVDLRFATANCSSDCTATGL